MSLAEPSAAAARFQPFSLSIVPAGDQMIVVPAGELDLESAHALDSEVRDLRRSGAEHVVVDLRQLGFVDSTGLRVLLSLRNDAKRDRAQLTLIRGRSEVQRVFHLTRTYGLFSWRDG